MVGPRLRHEQTPIEIANAAERSANVSPTLWRDCVSHQLHQFLHRFRPPVMWCRREDITDIVNSRHAISALCIWEGNEHAPLFYRETEDSAVDRLGEHLPQHVGQRAMGRMNCHPELRRKIALGVQRPIEGNWDAECFFQNGSRLVERNIVEIESFDRLVNESVERL